MSSEEIFDFVVVSHQNLPLGFLLIGGNFPKYFAAGYMGQVYALLAKKSLCLKSISFGNLEPNFFRIIA